MSYIFDALQRLQAERIEPDKARSLAAIQLLKHTEREASAPWNVDFSLEQVKTAEPEYELPRFSRSEFAINTAAADPIAAAKLLQDEERIEIFSHFQTLESTADRSNLLVCLNGVNSPATEAFHLLGVRLRHLQKERELKSLLITSTIPQEGKSVVAANLACMLGSGASRRVLLIDGDMRRASQSELFGIAQIPGLCNYLKGKRSLEACLYHLADIGIWILPAGDNPDGSRELIQSSQLPKLMTTLNTWFDWIVIDSPPVLPMADTSVLARLADGILLVARPGITRKKKLLRGVEALSSNRLIGALLNSSKNAIDLDYDYYRRTPEIQERPEEV